MVLDVVVEGSVGNRDGSRAVERDPANRQEWTVKPCFLAYVVSRDCQVPSARAVSAPSASDLPTVSVQSVAAWSRNGGHWKEELTVELMSAKIWFTF